MNAPAKAHGFPQLRALKISFSSELNIQKLEDKKDKDFSQRLIYSQWEAFQEI